MSIRIFEDIYPNIVSYTSQIRHQMKCIGNEQTKLSGYSWPRMPKVHFQIVLSVLLLHGCLTNSDKGTLLVQSQSTVEIPFDLESGLIILEARINGTKGRFLFDNGFSQSALDPHFAKRASVDFEHKSFLTDFYNTKQSTPQTIIDTTQIEHFYFLRTKFYEVATDQIFPCDSVDGIIGGSIINMSNWQIDFEHQIIRISSNPFTDRGIPLDVDFRDNNETLTEISIQHSNPIQCKIDFGSNSSLKLRYADVIDFLKGHPVEKRSGIRAISIHGMAPIESYYHTATPLILSQNDRELLPTTATLISDLKYSAYLGAEYFRDYMVSINSTNRQYVLSPKNFRDSTIIEPSYGVGLYLMDNRWKVIHKNDLDPTLSSVGILDQVLQLDQFPSEHFVDICAYREYLQDKKKRGEPLVLKIKGQDTALVVPYRIPETLPLE